MLEPLRAALLRLLRVPAEPHVPVGAGSIRVFRASPSYFRLKLLRWAVGQLGALAGLLGGLFFASALLGAVTHPWVVTGVTGAEVMAWGAFVLQLPFSLAVARLDFEMRWYILSDRSLRIREGVLSVREKTLTFANIQQIAIRQNPLQRLLGIADVQVRTAGGGSGGGDGVGESMHEAYFRGVDNAEEIRAAIRERVRLHRDAGLGDPDEPAPLAPAGDALAAALELRDEMRALRKALGSG